MKVTDRFIDLERLNFLAWYALATPEDIKTAWRNNAEKLEELLTKYKQDIDFMGIIAGVGANGRSPVHAQTSGKYAQ